MEFHIEKHRVFAAALVAMIGAAIAKALAAFLDGYYIFLPFYLGVFFIDLCARVPVIVTFCIVVIRSLIKRQFTLIPVIYWTFAILLFLIPSEHFQAIGAWLSIRDAGAIQVRDDARALLGEYEPMTYFGHRERYPFNNPLPMSRLPASIRATHIEAVLVLDDYVFLGKYGTTALLRGYVVFREEADVWKDKPSMTLLPGCASCWRIRIVDGLYWFHAVPQEDEISTFVSPLE